MSPEAAENEKEERGGKVGRWAADERGVSRADGGRTPEGDAH